MRSKQKVVSHDRGLKIYCRFTCMFLFQQWKVQGKERPHDELLFAISIISLSPIEIEPITTKLGISQYLYNEMGHIKEINQDIRVIDYIYWASCFLS